MTKQNNKVDWKIVCFGLACLTAAELYALSLGWDGWLLAVFFGIIGTAIGVAIPKEMFIKK